MNIIRQSSPVPTSKTLIFSVLLLDDTIETFEIPTKSNGVVLFKLVVDKLGLLEEDYFDLQYTNVQGLLCWLDHEKPIIRQLPVSDLSLRFIVKFYTPDPGLLQDEFTRYLFALQVKRDLFTGLMTCQEHTTYLLSSYIAQAEYGDAPDDDQPGEYLLNLKLLPNISQSALKKIACLHRLHVGQSSAEADFNLLDVARKTDLYGMVIHYAKDNESIQLGLCVTHMGIIVWLDHTRINVFSWAKIRKISFKRKRFLIKLHNEGMIEGFYKDLIEFYFPSRNDCKNFWKCCLEHHAFFRCQYVKKIPRNKTRVVSHGSSFRYCGRTQKQLTEYIKNNPKKKKVPTATLR